MSNLKDIDAEISRIKSTLSAIDPIKESDKYNTILGYYGTLLDKRKNVEKKTVSPDTIVNNVVKVGLVAALIWFENGGVETFKGAWNQALH